MKISTPLTELLGIDLPIIGAPMFLVSYADLVVAVSEAGGIGTFPSMNFRSLDELRDVLREIRQRTRKPIGVNIVLYKEHNPQWARQLEICLEFGVELIITSMGTPRTVVREARSTGARVFCDVVTLRQAQVVAKAGADALIAVSGGAGGHAGTISPFSLVPYLAEETGLPVIAAGSVTNGKQMAAALSLGAAGVYVGTRLIATPESRASEEYKAMLLASVPEEIVYTDSVSGVPANWLQRSLDRLEKLRESGESGDEFKRWRDIWSAGHGVAQIRRIEPAGEVIASMAREYEAVRRALPPME